MVLAEKTVTTVERGTANTRWRDFADLLLLTQRHDIDGDEVTDAVQAVAEHRGAHLRPLAEFLDGFADVAQDRWRRWVEKFELGDRLSAHFADVLVGVEAFADPVLRGEVAQQRWNATKHRWQ